jgi:hypothetical protein
MRKTEISRAKPTPHLPYFLCEMATCTFSPPKNNSTLFFDARWLHARSGPQRIINSLGSHSLHWVSDAHSLARFSILCKGRHVRSGITVHPTLLVLILNYYLSGSIYLLRCTYRSKRATDSTDTL